MVEFVVRQCALNTEDKVRLNVNLRMHAYCTCITYYAVR